MYILHCSALALHQSMYVNSIAQLMVLSQAVKSKYVKTQAENEKSKIN